jgi:hypothetical protein
MPGGFDAAKMWEKIKEQWPKKIYDTGKYHIKIPTPDNPFPLYTYFIGRYQVWERPSNEFPMPGLEWKVPGGCRGTLYK